MTETSIDRGLFGREVAVTGRLAAMTRGQALQGIRAAGGRYVARPTERTDLLVVGGDGPPLGEDGRPTRHLREAEELRSRGHPIRVVGEEEFLAMIGLEDLQPDLHRLYTTAQLSRILDVPAERVRAWVRQGLIRPAREIRRLAFFDFRQVASARALLRLAEGGVTPGRIRRSLRQLAHWVGETELSLAQLEVIEQGRTIVVRTGDGTLAEPSGQLRMDFEGAPPGPSPPLPRLVKGSAGEGSASFQEGLRAEEEGRLEDSVEAYRRAEKEGQPQPEASFNLGNALYALGKTHEAITCFQRAVEVDPDYVEAWNNLGNTQAESGRAREAVAAYLKALELEPHYADAHFNLAETLSSLGRTEDARRHWRAYLEEDPASSWAEVVRRRLRDTDS